MKTGDESALDYEVDDELAALLKDSDNSALRAEIKSSLMDIGAAFVLADIAAREVAKEFPDTEGLGPILEFIEKGLANVDELNAGIGDDAALFSVLSPVFDTTVAGAQLLSDLGAGPAEFGAAVGDTPALLLTGFLPFGLPPVPIPSSEVIALIEALIAELEAVLAAEIVSMYELALIREIIAELRALQVLISGAGGKCTNARQVYNSMSRILQLLRQLMAMLGRSARGMRVFTAFQRFLKAMQGLRGFALWGRAIYPFLVIAAKILLAALIGALIGYLLRKVTLRGGIKVGDVIDVYVYTQFYEKASCPVLYKLFIKARMARLKLEDDGNDQGAQRVLRLEIQVLRDYLAAGCADASIRKGLYKLLRQLDGKLK